MNKTQNFQKKVWIEINRANAEHNIRLIKSKLRPTTQLFAVVKSNAYGHGLLQFSQIAEQAGVDGFCVDSVIEGVKLRDGKIVKNILVIGPTLTQDLIEAAAEYNLQLSISSHEALERLIATKLKVPFQLKIDTGMHRQGFDPGDMKKVGETIVKAGEEFQAMLSGIFTHFAAAKDINYPTFTDMQVIAFDTAIENLRKGGVKQKILEHLAATGGMMVSSEYHRDAIRVGIGLYGMWPSKELEAQLGEQFDLRPVLSWHAVISETKHIPKGSFIGYDLAERTIRPTDIAILPIGYWHGFNRKLSHTGQALVNGKYARVIGRVSMDLVTLDVTGISCKPGDIATLIGKQGKEEIRAESLAEKMGTTHYEVVTCINPLILRVVV
ncbi:MAG: alanine racemase [Patescibacteria group bacterium]